MALPVNSATWLLARRLSSSASRLSSRASSSATPVDQAPRQCLIGVDELAGKQHLSGLLGADIAGQRHRRGGAEQPDLDTGDGEARRAGGHRHVTAGGQLAAGGGGQPLDASDHRHRAVLEALHDPGALGEELSVGVFVAELAHLLEVMTGAEGTALGGDHHRPQRRIGIDGGEGVIQRGEHVP